MGTDPKGNRFLRFTIGSPSFFAALSIVVFVADPLGQSGFIYAAALVWLMGFVILLARWRRTSRLEKAVTALLLLAGAGLAVPNW